MSNPLGFVLPAATIGLGSIVVRPKRGFFPKDANTGIAQPALAIVAQITLEEHHTDEMQITDHPVEKGAIISDHAYKLPAEVRITCGWSNSPSKATGLIGAAVGAAAALGGTPAAVLAAALPTVGAIQSTMSTLVGSDSGQVKAIYQKLLELQSSGVPFDILTGKRSYKNMLFKSLSVTTDQETENALMVVATCRQVLIATTRVVSSSVNADAQALPKETSPVVNVGPQNLLSSSTFTPDSTVFSGAITNLQSSMSQAQIMFDQLPGGVDALSGSVVGVVGNIPEALAQSQAALTTVAENIPAPFEIPLLANPQSLTINLGTPVTQTLADAVNALPSVLEQAQSVIGKAVSELPGITAELPSALNGLGPVLDSIQNRINTVLNKVPEVSGRITAAMKA